MKRPCVQCGNPIDDFGQAVALCSAACRQRNMMTLAPPAMAILENSNEIAQGVHNKTKCQGVPCPIHNRSEHHMRKFPQTFARGFMERVCSHGEHHPDPDAPPHHRPTKYQQHTGCCGCCTPEVDEDQVAEAIRSLTEWTQ